MHQEKEIIVAPHELVSFRSKVNNIKNINDTLRMALYSQMKSLLELKASGFFSFIFETSIAALNGVVDGAIIAQEKTDVSISSGLEKFAEALHVTLQSYLFTDSFMLEFLSANAEVYGVRNKLSLEYAKFISDCICFLEPDKEATKRTKYLFKPSLSSSVSVERIWSVEPPVCIINIPTETMLECPKKLLFMIAHEVSHYAGREYRKCMERNYAAKELCTIIFVQYSVNYFNMQIGRSSVDETNMIKNERKERILATIKYNRYVHDDKQQKKPKMYSAYCGDLKIKFQNIIESVEFIEAFNLGLHNSQKIYRFKDVGEPIPRQEEFLANSYINSLRKNVLFIQDFFMQLIKECTADIISAKILGISDAAEYKAMMPSYDIHNEGSISDIDCFSNLVRALIVAEVIKDKSDPKEKSSFTEYAKNEIASFELTPQLIGLKNRSDAISIDFIKYMVMTDGLEKLFELLDGINSQEELATDNPCRQMFNRVKTAKHSENYYESII